MRAGNFGIRGGLSLARCQLPTQPLSFPLLNRAGAENEMEKLVGQNKDREVTSQHHGQNRLDLGKIVLICCPLKQSWAVRNKAEARPFPHLPSRWEPPVQLLQLSSKLPHVHQLQLEVVAETPASLALVNPMWFCVISLHGICKCLCCGGKCTKYCHLLPWAHPPQWLRSSDFA